MKQFATKAELISEDSKGIKTYQIDWVDKHGVAHSDVSKGSDMKTALSAVLRKKVFKKLSDTPQWVWFASYSVFMAVYGAAAMVGNRPTLVVLGCFTLLFALRLAFDKYFRYVK
tara:strand:+ start:393 stop:734 length:342 start_codon:yes stop_codon:yes gene_type:complete